MYAVPPDLMGVLPAADVDRSHVSCAIVGNSASLLDQVRTHMHSLTKRGTLRLPSPMRTKCDCTPITVLVKHGPFTHENRLMWPRFQCGSARSRALLGSVRNTTRLADALHLE